MADEDVDPPGLDDDVWTVGSDESGPGPDEVGDLDGRDGSDRADDAPPSAIGGRSSRLVIGAVLLALGVIVAFVGIQRAGDDGSTAETPAFGQAPDPSAATTTAAVTSTAPSGPLVPTTIPGGELPTGCGFWDPAFSGSPKPVAGVSIYTDADGWHVRLAPDGPPVVVGTVVGQVTPLVSTEPPGPGVQLIADPATATVSFRLVAGEAPVGFDFAADCAQKQLTFDLKDEAGAPLDPATVHLGPTALAPAVPFVAQRTPADG